jgi:hypothetical protein
MIENDLDINCLICKERLSPANTDSYLRCLSKDHKMLFFGGHFSLSIKNDIIWFYPGSLKRIRICINWLYDGQKDFFFKYGSIKEPANLGELQKIFEDIKLLM